MLFDSLILAAVTDELGSTIVGGKVEKITQPTLLEIVIRIYHVGQTYQLLFSCDPQFARVHLTTLRRENPPQPSAFCFLLRKYLEGAFVHAVSLPLGFGERVLHVEFRATDGAPYTLIAEMMGRLSNVILVNGPGTILGAVKSFGQDVNRVRQVLPGLPYQPPPRQQAENKEPKRDPLAPYVPPSAGPMTSDDAQTWLGQTFMGISPRLAEEVIRRVPGDVLAPQALWNALKELLSVVHTHEWSPHVWSDERGVTQGAYPITLHSVPLSLQYSRDSISLALDHAASSLIQTQEFAQDRDLLLAALRRSRKRLEREQEELTKGLRNAERADEYQQSGDLLLANRGQIEKGQPQVSVADYYTAPLPSGALAARVILLDPTLNLVENAERFFQRSQKARRSAQTLRERRDHNSEALTRLSLAESETKQAKTKEQVWEIRDSLALLLTRNERGSGGPIGEGNATRKPEFAGYKIKTFWSGDGWEILVGENAAANDYLTTRVAASADIWLHVRAATSAHGVIRARSHPGTVSPAALQHAAELVAARSEVKHSSLIPVDYTLKKYVRKPRKSAPGAVTYQNEKTLYVAGIHG